MESQAQRREWTWVCPPSSHSHVCVVTDETTPHMVREALVEYCQDSPHISLLHLGTADQLRLGWLASLALVQRSEQKIVSEIEHVLAILPISCFLLLCTQAARSLDWLGAVRGHQCELAHLHPTTNDSRQLEVAFKAMFATLHSATLERWGDVF